MGRLIRRVRYVINRARHEDDLADELRFHQEMKEQQLRADGIPTSEVASSARRAIGNDLSARQYSRDVWIWPWLQGGRGAREAETSGASAPVPAEQERDGVGERNRVRLSACHRLSARDALPIELID